MNQRKPIERPLLASPDKTTIELMTFDANRFRRDRILGLIAIPLLFIARMVTGASLMILFGG